MGRKRELYTISSLFNILKKYKPNIIDSYTYSVENPPPHPNYKYTDKLFIACILNIAINNGNWVGFIGPIEGKQVNKRHIQYSNFKIYKDLYETQRNKYLHMANIKDLNIDSTINNNKNCEEVEKHLPCNKNRKGVKVPSINDQNGVPLIAPTTFESTVADSTIAITNINDILKNKLITKAIRRSKGRVYLLADSGYDTKEIVELSKNHGITPIIKPNNRRTKDGTKLRYLNKQESTIYNRRVKVEHFFGYIKRYPKVNCVYEKSLKSYEGILSLVFALRIINIRGKR